MGFRQFSGLVWVLLYSILPCCSSKVKVHAISSPLALIMSEFPVELDGSTIVSYAIEYEQPMFGREGFRVIYGEIDTKNLASVLHSRIGQGMNAGPIDKDTLARLPLGIIERYARNSPYPPELEQLVERGDIVYTLEAAGLLDDPNGRAKLLVICEASQEFAYFSWNYH